MVTLSVKIPEDMNNHIRSLAHKRKSNASTIIRKAVEQYLSSQPQSTQGSFLDLARDLVGSLQGPEDLAGNKKKYLRGYGR